MSETSPDTGSSSQESLTASASGAVKWSQTTLMLRKPQPEPVSTRDLASGSPKGRVSQTNRMLRGGS